jgi:hypothetical protein
VRRARNEMASRSQRCCVTAIVSATATTRISANDRRRKHTEGTCLTMRSPEPAAGCVKKATVEPKSRAIIRRRTCRPACHRDCAARPNRSVVQDRHEAGGRHDRKFGSANCDQSAVLHDRRGSYKIPINQRHAGFGRKTAAGDLMRARHDVLQSPGTMRPQANRAVPSSHETARWRLGAIRRAMAAPSADNATLCRRPR